MAEEKKPLPEQQRAPVPEADIPPPPHELVWLEKGYSPPAKENDSPEA